MTRIAYMCREESIFAKNFKFSIMAKEIERKFLVNDFSYRDIARETIEISQGYISNDPDRTVRVRLSDNSGFLTVKTRNEGAVRNEWEFEIPVSMAREMISATCCHILSKTRYIVPCSDGMLWEVDEFHGHLEGLVVAEIELTYEDQPFDIPDFIGREVTADPQYYNSNLASRV